MKISILIIAVCFFGCTHCVQHGKRIPNFAGPFRVIVRRLTNESHLMSPGKFWCKVNFSPAKPGQLQYRWGYTHLGIDMTDEQKIDMEISVWANNQWKQNAFILHSNHVCSDVWKYSPSLVKVMIGHSDSICPIKSGPRFLKNETFDITFTVLHVFPYGRYRATAIIRNKESEILAVQIAIVDVVPRL